MVSASFILVEVGADSIETDINVPLIVRGPGIGKNVTLDAITSHTDLAPTFLSLAGATKEGLDGKKIPTTVEASTAHNRSEHVAIEYWGLVSVISTILPPQAHTHTAGCPRRYLRIRQRQAPTTTQQLPTQHLQGHQTSIRRL